MLNKLIYDLLANDTNITSRLSTYEFTTGSSVVTPSIFTAAAPADVEAPYITMSEITSKGNVENRIMRGYIQNIDLRVVTDRLNTSKVLKELQHYIFSALHKSKFEDDYVYGWLECGGGTYYLDGKTRTHDNAIPGKANFDDVGFPSYRIQVTATLWIKE